MNSFRCHQCGASGLTSTKPSDLNATPDLGKRHRALLNSNEAPVDSDVAIVKLAISKNDARLASLDSEIARLRELLEQLEEERVSLLSDRTQNQAILSPLRKMPPEVLGDIFFWTLPSLRVARATGTYITHSPWVLIHVSRRFREVAISTSSLWSLVVVIYRRVGVNVFVTHDRNTDNANTHTEAQDSFLWLRNVGPPASNPDI
ncbi:ABC protein [Mycena venus]|uniref:ABC protein n=1 Tax=Mycena venus TaxID=2733690 RepID=A0A8H6XQA0_9AGAR|nr:ABC protein [Mycena venus]